MKDQSSAANEVRQILSQKIIPQISSRDFENMTLAQRPLRLPPEIIAKRTPAPALKVNDQQRSGWFLAQNKEEAMHAIQVPYLCYVVEGEIDMRLGIPAQRGKSRGIVNSYEILTLPANSFLLIPPGVFFPEVGAHWERPSSRAADSRLFWLHILPTGALCHTCTTRKGIHTPNNYHVFVPDIQLAPLTELLMEELQSSDRNFTIAASSALLLLACHVRRRLDDNATVGIGPNLNSHTALRDSAITDTTSSVNSAIIEKACDYIRKKQPHDLNQIASHVYVSPSHLAKLFRTHLNTTVMKYVLEQRMEVARSFLLNTDMSIQEIAQFTGYMQPPQFTRVFKQLHHITPKEFREKHRRKEN